MMASVSDLMNLGTAANGTGLLGVETIFHAKDGV